MMCLEPEHDRMIPNSVKVLMNTLTALLPSMDSLKVEDSDAVRQWRGKFMEATRETLHNWDFLLLVQVPTK